MSDMIDWDAPCSPEDAPKPATFDVQAKAANDARRPMDNLPVRMAVVRSLHSTWKANAPHAQEVLWHYGSRAIAGDY